MRRRVYVGNGPVISGEPLDDRLDCCISIMAIVGGAGERRRKRFGTDEACADGRVLFPSHRGDGCHAAAQFLPAPSVVWLDAERVGNGPSIGVAASSLGCGSASAGSS